MKRYIKKAESGDKVAQFYLGQSYFYGNNGVEKDEKEAIKW